MRSGTGVIDLMEQKKPDNIKVFVRLKPVFDEREKSVPISLEQNCIIFGDEKKQERFFFDFIGTENISQVEVFEKTALELTDNCLQGYNGTIFAYGQTGTGKTYTMQGGEMDDKGIIPRTIEYLFRKIGLEKQTENKISFECKCTYIEIYNEVVYDLLGEGRTSCSVREDIRKGVYIDGCVEHNVGNAEETLAVFLKGTTNRHVGETNVNRESSRSHSVFTIYICSSRICNGIIDKRHSQFNLVDLAGSERQHNTKTTGQRLKEAGNINRSLFALGNVINSLVEVSHGHMRHVHYRDSKLTFLLRDSFGGNAKTLLIANITSSYSSLQETLSTLRFAQRAKMIQNKAVVNKDVQGNIEELKEEIKRLRIELEGGGMSGKGEGDRKMLNITFEKLRETERKYDALNDAFQKLEDVCRKKEKQIQAERLIIKLRDNALRLYREGSMTPSESEKIKEKEIEQLRKQLIINEKTSTLSYENLILKQKLQDLVSFSEQAEKTKKENEKAKKYQSFLLDRILSLSGKETQKEALEEKENVEKIENKKRPRIDNIEGLQSELEIKETRLHSAVVQLHELKTKHRLMNVEHEIMNDEMQYLSKMLSEKEKELFELKATISSSSDLAEEKTLSSTGHGSFKSEESFDYQKQIKELRESLFQEKKKNEEFVSNTEELVEQRCKQLKNEMAVLEKKNLELVKHNNMKQKIQHIYNIKQENNALCEQIRLLRDENTRLKNMYKEEEK